MGKIASFGKLRKANGIVFQKKVHETTCLKSLRLIHYNGISKHQNSRATVNETI